MIPNFTTAGMLPPGDYTATFDELRQSVLVIGAEERSPNWDSDWRLYLVDQLEILARELWRIGITNIYADGSFAEEKDHPNDVDGYFECDRIAFLSGQIERELNLINPHKVWTWDPATRRPFRAYPKPQLPMWHHYRVELWPHYGQSSGIVDQHGYELDFPAAFRKSRDHHQPRGIVQLVA
jgi:hypothetical protein